MKNGFRVTALLLAFLLAACGGGGGGSSGMLSDIISIADDLPPSSSFGEDVVSNQDRLDNTRQAATSLPAFGSVTQSRNADVSGITTDAAETTFTGDRFTLTVTREDGSSFTLDTDTDETDIGNPGLSEVTGRRSQTGVIAKGDTASIVAAGALVDWQSDDATDYLAGGYWLYIEGDIASGNVTGAEIGAFVDGPELSGMPQIPVTGTATYDGIAGGIYATRYGSDAVSVPEGTYETGEYLGEIRLTADFSTSNISGMIHSIGFHGAYIQTPNGSVDSIPDDPQSDYQLLLGSLGINPDGTFRGSGVRLTHPQLNITSTEGTWGGKLSTINDSAGNPRIVAGTHGGAATTSGGSEAAFIGAFYGATPQFKRDVQSPQASN